MGIVLVVAFVASSGLPLFLKVNPLEFVLGSEWRPTAGRFGILPLMLGTLAVVAGALLIGGTTGIAVAVFLSEFCPRPVKRVFKVIIELLAGIPSVVYGFFGIVLLVPFVRTHVGGSGFGVLSASIILGAMILPTVSAVAENALSSVPNEYRLAGLGLGATDWQTVWHIVLPAASAGIAASLILGIGRAIGETMAVLMVIGNSPQMPTSLVKPVGALTSAIALDMPYASGHHQTALFAIGVVLLVAITLLLISVRTLRARIGGSR